MTVRPRNVKITVLPVSKGVAEPAPYVGRTPYTAPPGMRKGCVCGATWGGIPLKLVHVRNRANCPLHRDLPPGDWEDLP